MIFTEVRAGCCHPGCGATQQPLVAGMNCPVAPVKRRCSRNCQQSVFGHATKILSHQQWFLAWNAHISRKTRFGRGWKTRNGPRGRGGAFETRRLESDSIVASQHLRRYRWTPYTASVSRKQARQPRSCLLMLICSSSPAHLMLICAAHLDAHLQFIRSPSDAHVQFIHGPFDAHSRLVDAHLQFIRSPSDAHLQSSVHGPSDAHSRLIDAHL